MSQDNVLTGHVVTEEVAGTYETVGLSSVSQGESGGPIDQSPDANIQPILNQDIHRILRPNI